MHGFGFPVTKMNRVERQQKKLANALAAIPEHDQPFLSGNQIHNRQSCPRLHRRNLYPILHSLAESGRIERDIHGFMHYYRLKAGETLADKPDTHYNDQQRNKFSLDANVDHLLRAVRPLRFGKVVQLWLILPPVAGRKTTKVQQDKLVIISPGQTIGFPKGVILVSIIGQGSSLIRPLLGEGVANLVLAGMPAKLAKFLMDAIHRVLKE